jgi:putative tryptophan/tyrosine transport system substrate-binding protein
MPVVGFVDGTSADAAVGRIAAFRKGLGETGYVEGKNVQVEYYYSGQYERQDAEAFAERFDGERLPVIGR